MANTASPTRKDLDTLAGEWQVELSLTRSHTVFVPSTATARKDRTAWIGDSK
jgi:hypothetical protein